MLGTVTDEAGNGIAGATVAVLAMPGQPPTIEEPIRTEADGTYRIVAPLGLKRSSFDTNQIFTVTAIGSLFGQGRRVDKWVTVESVPLVVSAPGRVPWKGSVAIHSFVERDFVVGVDDIVLPTKGLAYPVHPWRAVSREWPTQRLVDLLRSGGDWPARAGRYPGLKGKRGLLYVAIENLDPKAKTTRVEAKLPLDGRARKLRADKRFAKVQPGFYAAKLYTIECPVGPLSVPSLVSIDGDRERAARVTERIHREATPEAFMRGVSDLTSVLKDSVAFRSLSAMMPPRDASPYWPWASDPTLDEVLQGVARRFLTEPLSDDTGKAISGALLKARPCRMGPLNGVWEPRAPLFNPKLGFGHRFGPHLQVIRTHRGCLDDPQAYPAGTLELAAAAASIGLKEIAEGLVKKVRPNSVAERRAAILAYTALRRPEWERERNALRRACPAYVPNAAFIGPR